MAGYGGGMSLTTLPKRLALGLEATLLISATVASCFVTYEIVRRPRVLRPLFGLKIHESAKARIK
jgi:hypothetical protein